MTYDLTGRVAAVNTVPLGGTLAEEAPAGATVPLVEDTADFDPDGGALLLGGAEVVTYTSADDESGRGHPRRPHGRTVGDRHPR
ncbi:hypothetical protein [Promicromonospora kroppenstedtii]|uniref:hypothetical protein n=1 Tax=Promicromonospora kroppenstedtii TaxID=440482 RepID=UPI0004B20C2E|nr:hypothetical protein [Promicromonospora kroppenstedtii]